MPKTIKDKIQEGADQLWWSKDPDIKNPKRFRRFVSKMTAIGPKNQGGLGQMLWPLHAESFTAQWIINYVANPAGALWKDLLDSILLINKRGEREPEGRGILFSNIGVAQKRALLKRIPKKAKYIRTCLNDFWKLKLKPAIPLEDRDIVALRSEPLWFNHDFEIKLDHWKYRDYFRRTLKVVHIGDLISKDTNKILSIREMKRLIEETHIDETGSLPNSTDLRMRTEHYKSIIEQLPQVIKQIIEGAIDAIDYYTPSDWAC